MSMQAACRSKLGKAEAVAQSISLYRDVQVSF